MVRAERGIKKGVVDPLRSVLGLQGDRQQWKCDEITAAVLCFKAQDLDRLGTRIKYSEGNLQTWRSGTISQVFTGNSAAHGQNFKSSAKSEPPTELPGCREWVVSRAQRRAHVTQTDALSSIPPPAALETVSMRPDRWLSIEKWFMDDIESLSLDEKETSTGELKNLQTWRSGTISQVFTGNSAAHGQNFKSSAKSEPPTELPGCREWVVSRAQRRAHVTQTDESADVEIRHDLPSVHRKRCRARAELLFEHPPSQSHRLSSLVAGNGWSPERRGERVSHRLMERDDAGLRLPDSKDPGERRRFTSSYDKNPDSAEWTTVWVAREKPEQMF
ncbi:hypothetical protein MG293_020442 [Ovis ammon polii]|uniref:Uncharacterized protein n=1 Tax=Ovis ammon polii TaxID=230172 RepID=A0AAD4XZ68_OVIAM|nr:hypothetical protein MG293_020442 [Ovis ammon polii]